MEKKCGSCAWLEKNEGKPYCALWLKRIGDMESRRQDIMKLERLKAKKEIEAWNRRADNGN